MHTRIRFWLWVLILVVLGCDGESRFEGDPGPQGAQGPRGAGTVVWKDANGVEVPGIFTNNLVTFQPVSSLGAVHYQDPQGLIWAINIWTGELSPAIENFTAGLRYSGASCTGLEFIADGTAFDSPGDLLVWPAPRMTFTVGGDPRIRVIKDDAAVVTTEFCTVTTDAGNTCSSPNCVTHAGISTSDTLIISQTPNVFFTAPLHPELP